MRIMIADDEAAIRESLERVLQVEGYDTSTVANGLAVLDGVGGDAPDLLILDVMMPRLGGLETCRRLRAAGRDLPVLMLTARDQVSDRVAGLDAGADDYLPKPFATEELLARVRALLRRSAPDMLEAGGVQMDLAARRVLVEGAEVTLANKEFELLRVLLFRSGQVISRDEILRDVWHDPELKTSKTLDMHMSWLRRKIGSSRIKTVRGVGFRFDAS